MPWGSGGYLTRVPPRGGTPVRYPPGGTRVRYPPGGTRVRYPPQGGTRVRYPPRGDPSQVPPWWGVPGSGTPPPPPPGGYPGRTTEGVLTTRRAVCLLRSRRRTFLLHRFFSQLNIQSLTIWQENHHQQINKYTKGNRVFFTWNLKFYWNVFLTISCHFWIFFSPYQNTEFSHSYWSFKFH